MRSAAGIRPAIQHWRDDPQILSNPKEKEGEQNGKEVQGNHG
jgi:hypothetical protein